MIGLNFRHISLGYSKFFSIIYQTCVGWIRYHDVGHRGNSIIAPHTQLERDKVISVGVHIEVKKKAFKINAKIEDVGLNKDKISKPCILLLFFNLSFQSLLALYQLSLP